MLPATIKFRSKDTGEEYELGLNMVDVFEYDKIYYEVSKGYIRTFKEVYEGEYPDGLSSKEGWYLPTKEQALKLTGLTQTATWTNDKSLSDDSPGKTEKFDYWSLKYGTNLDHTYEFKANCASNGQWISYGKVGHFRVYTTEGKCGPDKIPAVRWRATGGVKGSVTSPIRHMIRSIAPGVQLMNGRLCLDGDTYQIPMGERYYYMGPDLYNYHECYY